MAAKVKKRLPVITVILTIAMVVVGYYAFKTYIYPTYINSGNQTLELELNKQEFLRLEKLQSQGTIYSLKFQLLGRTNENVHLTLYNADTIPLQNISLKKGEIDYIYSGDWYSNFCFLGISPIKSGELKLEYQFLALD